MSQTRWDLADSFPQITQPLSRTHLARNRWDKEMVAAAAGVDTEMKVDLGNQAMTWRKTVGGQQSSHALPYFTHQEVYTPRFSS